MCGWTERDSEQLATGSALYSQVQDKLNTDLCHLSTDRAPVLARIGVDDSLFCQEERNNIVREEGKWQNKEPNEFAFTYPAVRSTSCIKCDHDGLNPESRYFDDSHT